jgi:hypothetical protein
MKCLLAPKITVSCFFMDACLILLWKFSSNCCASFGLWALEFLFWDQSACISCFNAPSPFKI